MTSKRRSCRIPAGSARFIAALLAGISFSAAGAYPDRFGVYIDNGLGGALAQQSDPVHASVSVSSPAPIWAGSASAGPSLGAYTMASTALADPNPVPGAPPNPPWRVRAGAGAEYYDAMITGTGDTFASPLKLALDGFLTGAITPRPGGSVDATISVTSYVSVTLSIYDCPHADCAGSTYNSFREFSIGRSGFGNEEGRDGSGFLWTSGAWNSVPGTDSIHAVVSTDAMVLPVNRPFSFSISITTWSVASASYPYSLEYLAFIASGAADFSHTLGLPAGTPLLALPDGFRFDAASVGIVDNLCVGSACVATPVPEPPTLLMWMCALSLALTARRWHGRRGSAASVPV